MQEQTKNSSTKDRLLSAIDAELGNMDGIQHGRFLSIAIEEVVRLKPNLLDSLTEYLSRLGWAYINGSVIPLAVLHPKDLLELPMESREDLVKASTKFRDGDHSGAVTSACAAVDAVTTAIYRKNGLGDPMSASFQQRCTVSLRSQGVLQGVQFELERLEWAEPDIKMFKDNLQKALNHAAYVMQSLRSRMGDVHGSKPILRPLAFDCLRWAELLIGALGARENQPSGQ